MTRILRLAVLSAGAVLVLFPFLFMLSTSLKPQSEVFSAGLSLIPSHWAIVENYGKAFTRIPMARILLNGVVVCASIVAFQIVFALPAAYALAKLRFRGRELYAAARITGLLNTLAVLVVPFTLSVFAIFLFRQFIKAIPDDLILAARSDGLSEAAIVWRIILPNAWPAASAFAIFSVVAHWNDLYWPLIAISKTQLATPPLGLLFFRAAEAGDDYGALMAATVVITMPLILFFLFAQRLFIEGMTMTGLKG
ncbi:MAG: carbohydrate ABC transporter permease [Alphaproteobacteria bacterium]|nr:carbohydrate ABC transporter permease [Alphaproteobacteria bacterium]